jgi:hypothetical protein
MGDTKRNLDLVLSELVEEIRHQSATHTELVGHVRGLIANDVLLVATYVFPSSGILAYDFPAPYGCVQVSNDVGNDGVTVTADTPEASAPSGRGAYWVPDGQAATIVLHGKALTFYGTAGDRISFQVLTRVMPPVAG